MLICIKYHLFIYFSIILSNLFHNELKFHLITHINNLLLQMKRVPSNAIHDCNFD